MIWLLFFRSGGWQAGLNYEQQLRQNYNLQPFLTIRNYWKVVYHRTNDAALIHSIINLGGNIFLFIPIGELIPGIYPKLRNFFRFFCVCLGVMFLVEVLQLFTLLGSFDVDDLILNLFGMSVGFVCYHLFRKK
jgi:glycopeptide antibiotics resistance protein